MKKEIVMMKQVEDGYIILAKVEHSTWTEWVTWRSNLDSPTDTYWGNYFDNYFDAEEDFNKRG